MNTSCATSPKGKPRREVGKENVCEIVCKKRTQQNRIYYVVQGCTLAKQIQAYGMCTHITESLSSSAAGEVAQVALTCAGQHRKYRHW